MECSAEDAGAPDSWEMADLDESMRRLMLSCKKTRPPTSSCSLLFEESPPKAPESTSSPTSVNSSCLLPSAASERNGRLSEDALNEVDQFLRDALQNPRERLSVLRLEQDVLKFIRDPSQQQLEFQQLPTSYLRLAAHRVAQHYNLQSMVIQDPIVPDGSGSRIIVRKTPGCRIHSIRLADIPINLPQEECNNNVKVAIKQRSEKHPQLGNRLNVVPSRANMSKSVEERKEEYNRARARIFNGSSSSSGTQVGKLDGNDSISISDMHCQKSLLSDLEEKHNYEGPDVIPGPCDSSVACSSRYGRTKTEKDVVTRYKPSNRIAIFRDREVDRKDPDYDRSYERYTQRYDPGFGFNAGPYAVQPLYAPALNYNTEFPQLGSAAPGAPQATSIEHQTRPLPQHHFPGPWGSTTNTSSAVGYASPENMIGPLPPYNLSHVGPHSTSPIYHMHSSQYNCPRSGMAFAHPHENVHQSFPQSLQQKHEASSGVARPR